MKIYSVSQALSRVGLVIRNDSKLHDGYIHNTLEDWTLDQIVRMTVQMHWLFNYTPYKKELDRDVKAVAEQIYEFEGNWQERGDYSKTTNKAEPGFG